MSNAEPAMGGPVRGTRGEEDTESAATVTGLQDWLVAALARELELDAVRIGIRTPFADFGIESVQALALAADLEDLLGRPLPATLLWDYPTIEALSRHLAEVPT